ncbi:MAG: major capsid protein [Microviridae sp.]|nr:MAG: major capsid protein [Microviridae sp.]
MKKTLGGDRLSSGKKMTVNLKAYQRSTHNRGYIWRNTQSPGTLVPFMVQVATPGSTCDIDLDIDIMTHPTIGPLLGSFKVDAHIFQCPVRLYHSWLHNNRLKIGMNMGTVLLPQITLTTQVSEAGGNDNVDNAQINPSCLLAYLGIRGIGWSGVTAQPRTFNGIPLLAYWDIYKNYYSNKQEEIGAYICGVNEPVSQTIDSISIDGDPLDEAPAVTPILIQYGDNIVISYTGATPNPSEVFVRVVGVGGDQYVSMVSLSNDLVDTGTTWQGTVTNYVGNTAINWRYQTSADIPIKPPVVKTFPLDNIDNMREQLLANSGGTAFDINSVAIEPYVDLLAVSVNDLNPRLNTQEGLAVKTYQSDLFNNWLNTEWIDGAGGITELSRVSTAGGFFTMDQLLSSRKIYDLLNRIGATGGTYKDWIEAAYTEIDWNKVESPVYWGGLIKELVFQEVVSNSESSDGKQPLGTLAGKGVMAKKHKGGKIVVKVEEHSYIIGLICLTPRIDYSQGNAWDAHLVSMDDFHKPGFDEIGFQESINEQRAWWSTTWNGAAWVTTSAGKQPAWLNYMTETNKVFGNFAIENNEMFMVLARRFEREDGEIKDLTTYIDPAKYNFIFADTSIDAMNFWVQVAVDFTYRAKMSGKLMPNL